MEALEATMANEFLGVKVTSAQKKRAAVMAHEDGGRSVSSLVRRLLDEAWARRALRTPPTPDQ